MTVSLHLSFSFGCIFCRSQFFFFPSCMKDAVLSTRIEPDSVSKYTGMSAGPLSISIHVSTDLLFAFGSETRYEHGQMTWPISSGADTHSQKPKSGTVAKVQKYKKERDGVTGELIYPMKVFVSKTLHLYNIPRYGSPPSVVEI